MYIITLNEDVDFTEREISELEDLVNANIEWRGAKAELVVFTKSDYKIVNLIHELGEEVVEKKEKIA